MTLPDRATLRHITCVHAKACRRVTCLPAMNMIVWTRSGDMGDPLSRALACDCCNEYERRVTKHEGDDK